MLEDEWDEWDEWDDVTVCPVHLRFVPCRRCELGHEQYSTDPSDVERTRKYQQGSQNKAP